MKFHLFFGLLVFSSVCLDAYGQMIDSVERKRNEYEKIRSSSFGLLPHRQMYLMPYSYNWMPHNDLYESLSQNTQENKGDMYRNAEAEFQISFAISIVKDIAKKDWDIMGAYTHNSYWQVYNSGWSRPFRETNYMPELFSRYLYKHPKEFFGINLHGIDAGYVHQSNGQVHEISRSWDRFFVRGLFEFKGLYAQVSLWNRIPEKRELDDNRDILDYMGYGEIELTKKFEKHTFHIKTPLLVKYLGYDIKYSHPLNEGIRWFINFRSGYGHSLIEYNRQTQRLGAGVMLDNILY
jgi:phospholipase A1